MNRQEIFDKVAAHLLKQNARCVDPQTERCQYKNTDGLKCAVGALIPDGHEAQNSPADVYTLLEAYPDIKKSLDVKDWVDENFLATLQNIHDNFKPVEWHVRLASFALNQNLVFKDL